jgi:hypothetical protein
MKAKVGVEGPLPAVAVNPLAGGITNREKMQRKAMMETSWKRGLFVSTDSLGTKFANQV